MVWFCSNHTDKIFGIGWRTGNKEYDVYKRWMACLGMALSVFMGACGGGGGSPGANPNDGALSLGAVTALTLMPGEARSLPVSGGVSPYRVVSTEEAIATAVLDGNRLVIGGNNAGSTTVTVSDRAGASVPLAVTVGTSIELYTTAPASLSIGVGPTEARTFRVAGGVKPYMITGSNALVAQVTPIGTDQWRIEGIAIGDMQVRIRDAAGKELNIAVTVGSPEFRISSDNLTIPAGIPATVVLSGGQRPYRLAGGIPAAIQVRQVAADEYEIIGLLATNNVDVVFADAAGKTVKVTVTVNTANTLIRLSPSAVAVPEQSGATLRFNVFTGARGDLQVFSSAPNLVSVASIVSPSFNADGTVKDFGSFVATVSGTQCVAVDTPVTLTVIDTNGSVGTAVVTVTNSDPAACP
jgi:hypothetical protein